MRYANVCGYLHLHQAMQQCVVLPSELVDRIQDSDTVYLQQIQLIFLQSISRFRLLQNFDLREFLLALHHYFLAYDFWGSSYVGSFRYFLALLHSQ
jgi:hypothetical protein